MKASRKIISTLLSASIFAGAAPVWAQNNDEILQNYTGTISDQAIDMPVPEPTVASEYIDPTEENSTADIAAAEYEVIIPDVGYVTPMPVSESVEQQKENIEFSNVREIQDKEYQFDEILLHDAAALDSAAKNYAYQLLDSVLHKDDTFQMIAPNDAANVDNPLYTMVSDAAVNGILKDYFTEDDLLSISNVNASQNRDVMLTLLVYALSISDSTLQEDIVELIREGNSIYHVLDAYFRYMKVQSSENVNYNAMDADNGNVLTPYMATEKLLSTMSLSSANTNQQLYDLDSLYKSQYNGKVDGDVVVNPVTGNISYTYTLVSIPEKNGGSMDLTIKYDSSQSRFAYGGSEEDGSGSYPVVFNVRPFRQYLYDHGLGIGWDICITHEQSNTVVLADGRVMDDDYNYNDVIYNENDDSYDYLDGTKEYMNENNYVQYRDDKYGNRITYEYEEVGEVTRLKSISDQYGRKIQLNYYSGYVEIVRPDNTKMHLKLDTRNITGVGHKYGFNETMTIDVLSGIYDVSTNSYIATFDYEPIEYQYYLGSVGGSILGDDWATCMVMNEYDASYGQDKRFDYTDYYSIQSSYRTYPKYGYTGISKEYIGSGTTPAVQYNYITPKQEDITVESVTSDNQVVKSTYDGVHSTLKQDVYKRVGDTDILHTSSETESLEHYPDKPVSVISKTYNDNGNYITTEQTYTYNSYAQATEIMTEVDGEEISSVENEYATNKYRSLIKTKMKTGDTVHYTTNYTVNDYGDILSIQTLEGGDTAPEIYNEQLIYSNTSHNLIERKIVDGNKVVWKEEYDYLADGVQPQDVYLTHIYSGSTTVNEYDWLSGRVVSVKSSDGTRSEDTEYDALGRVKKITHADGSYIRTWYEPIDHAVAVINENNYGIEYFYSRYGGLSYAEETTDRSKRLQEVEYDALGRPAVVTDAENNQTEIEYDCFGRQTKVIYPPVETASAEEAAYAYYYDVFLEGDNKYSVYLTISPEGKIAAEYYDTRGRLSKVVAVKNPQDLTNVNWENIYQMPSNAQLAVTASYTYDELDRLIQEQDGEGRTTSYTYDVLGNMLTMTQGTGTNSPSVEYEYDMAGNVLEMTQGEGNETYQYDVYGRLIKTTDPMGFTETYTYDAYGNVMFTKDKNGKIATHEYDNRNRLIQTVKGGLIIDYTYDSVGNLLTSKDASGTISYEYNPDGTLSKKTYPDGKFITYDSYDNNKQLTQLTDYFGNTIEYDYNARGLVSSISENYSGPLSVKTTSYSYYADGMLKNVDIPNHDAETRYTYNYAGLISDVRNVNSSDGYVYNSHTYTYDNSGYIVGRADNVVGTATSTSYIYDSAGRLIREDVSGKGWNIYSYDENNNLVSEFGFGDTYYTYDANNRLTHVEDLWCPGETADGTKQDDWEIDYTYDNNGNLLSSDKYSDNYDSNYKTYAYDAFGRMTSFSDSLGLSATYTYYSDGLRKSKTVGTDTLTYYYNGDDIINESKNGSNTTSYLMGADGYICRRQSGQYEYYFKNAHGDVVYAMYTNGGCLGNFRYTAWGEHVSDYSFYSGIDQVPIRYAGEYYDYESGMTYLRARYYDSDIKRFITEDPAKDGLNWYAYCGNNPVMFVDPSGEKYILDDLARWIWRQGAEHYLRNQKGWYLTATLLELSTYDSGQSFVAHDGEYAAELIKNDKSFVQFVNDIIWEEGTSKGATYVYKSTTYEFNLSNGDLGAAIHNADVYITANQLEDGSWSVYVEVEDTFDFTEFKNPLSYDTLKEVFLWTMNDLAYLDQAMNVIHPVECKIDFAMRI